MNTDTDSSSIHVPIQNDGDVALNKQPSSSSSSSSTTTTPSSRSMLKWGAIIFALIALVGICTVVGITMSKKSNTIPPKSIAPAALTVAGEDVLKSISLVGADVLKSTSSAASVAGEDVLKSTSPAASVADMDVQDTCTPATSVKYLNFYIVPESTQLRNIWINPYATEAYILTVVCKTSTPPGKIEIYAKDANTRSGYWNVPSACAFNPSTSRYEFKLRLVTDSLALGEYHIYIQAGDSQIPTTDYTYAVALTNCNAGLFKVGEYDWNYILNDDGFVFYECQDPPNAHCNSYQIQEAKQVCTNLGTYTEMPSSYCPSTKPTPLTARCLGKVGCPSGQTCTTDNVCSLYVWEDAGTVSDCTLPHTAKCYDYKRRRTNYRCKDSNTGEYVDDYYCTGTKPTSTTITCSEKGTCECVEHPNHTGCANSRYKLNENDKYDKCDTKIGCPSTQFCQITSQTTNIINGVITTHIGQCVAGGGSGGDGSGGDGDSTAQCSQHPNHTGCDNFLYREIAPDLLEKCDTKIGGCSSSQFCNTGIRDIQMYNGVVTSSDLGRCEYDQSRSNSASIATVIMSVFMVFVALCVM